MKSIKLKKRTDENNYLGFENIEIIDKQLSYTYKINKSINPDEISVPHEFYFYEFIAIADSSLIRICEHDWESLNAYDVVK